MWMSLPSTRFRYYKPLRFSQNLSLLNLNNTLVSVAREDLLLLQGAYPAVWIHSTGSLQERIQSMTYIIQKVRGQVLEKCKSAHAWSPMKGKFNFIDGLYKDQLRKVSLSSDVIPIILPWIENYGGTDERPLNTLRDETNLLIQKYYQWTGHPTLCNLINSGITNMNYHIVHQNNCISNLNASISPDSMLLVTLNARPAMKAIAPWYPPSYYTDLPKHVTFLLIATNAVFTIYGDLYTRKTKYAPYTCSRDLSPKYDPKFELAPLYDEVFTIAQFWGEAFFHKNVEEFPRLGAFLPWLRENPQVKLHVKKKDKFVCDIMEYLGISKDRLVLGPLRAKLAYMPEASTCGFNLVTNTQLLSANYREVIHTMFKGKF